MEYARQTVEIALSQRKSAGIRIRQPLLSLATITPTALSEQIKLIIKEEVNVKKATNIAKANIISATLDTTITPELEAEGQARDLVRKIQEERKRVGTKLDEKVDVELPEWPKDFEDYIKKQALVYSLTKGNKLQVKRS